ASTPPVEDFSAPDNDPATCAAPPAASAAETASSAIACDNAASRPTGASADDGAASQPLLSRRNLLPVTEVQVTPDQPGATISQAALSPPLSQCPLPDSQHLLNLEPRS